MEFLKELFGEEALTYEAFSKAVTDKGLKLADLSTGNYVGTRKYEDELSAKDNAIEDLRGQLKTRDDDIKELQDQLSSDADNETKVADLTNQLEKLQGDYDVAKRDYEARLSKQSYEFAVSEYANTLNFTSEAAKREFKRAMVSENLKVKDSSIIGADDFTEVYRKANEDSFVIEAAPEGTPDVLTSSEGDGEPKPSFVKPTAPTPAGTDNPFASAFNFIGVRAKETE